VPNPYPAQSNMSAGELSPKLDMRSDFNKYNNGLSKMENVFSLVVGGAQGRGGTRLAHRVKHHTRLTRMIPFTFNTIQAYEIEFGHLYARFYRNGGIITEDPQTVLGAANNGSGLIRVEVFNHGYDTSDTVIISGVLGTVEANGEWIITVVDGDHFDLQGSSFVNAYTSGGAVVLIVEITHPYTEDELFTIKYQQSADFLYLAHPSHVQAKITRFSHIDWRFTEVELLDGPYMKENKTTTTLMSAAATGDNILITASAALGINDDQGFLTTDVNRLLRLNHGGSWGYAKIITVTDTTHVRVDIVNPFISFVKDIEDVVAGGAGRVSIKIVNHPFKTGQVVTVEDVTGTVEANGEWTIQSVATDTFELTGSTFVNTYTGGGTVGLNATGATASWRLGMWSETTGYPRCLGFFEQRLGWAGSRSFPQHVGLSRTGDFEDHAPTDQDGTISAEHAIVYEIASEQVNVVLWLIASRQLLIGTTGGEWSMFGSQDEALSAKAVNTRQHTAHGVADIAPVKIENTAMFVQKALTKVRGLAFSFDADGYQADDMTLLADHILESGAVELAYQQEPFNAMWIVRNDGVMATMVFNKKQEVISWARHITEGDFESVSVIPGPNGRDQVWCVVRRVIDGDIKRYVEYIDDSINTDSSLSYSGPATQVLTGLGHLEDKVVAIVGNGAVYPPETVVGGAITLDGPEVTEATVGLGYLPFLKTLSPEVPMPGGGTSHGKPRRWYEVFVRLFQTMGLNIDGEEVPFRTPQDDMDTPLPLFTGDKSVTHSGWDQEGKLEIYQPHPLPFTVLGIFGRLDVGE